MAAAACTFQGALLPSLSHTHKQLPLHRKDEDAAITPEWGISPSCGCSNLSTKKVNLCPPCFDMQASLVYRLGCYNFLSTSLPLSRSINLADEGIGKCQDQLSWRDYHGPWLTSCQAHPIDEITLICQSARDLNYA